MCGPICAIGIAGGLGLSKLLGIDDLTLGFWIGALILSFSVQLNKFLVKKGKSFLLSFWVVFLITWFLSFLPIWNKLGWNESSCFYGLPRVMAGSFLGMFILFFSDWLDDIFLKKFHNDKVYFPYQRVIIPIIALIILSIIFELWICKIFI